MYLARIGSLSTLSRKQPGFPFGSVMPYGLDGIGHPVFLPPFQTISFNTPLTRFATPLRDREQQTRPIAKLEQLGVEESVVALVLPAGYSFNHDGTCLYWATVSVFLAQAGDIHLSIGQQLALLATMLFTSKGGAGVAGSAIVVLATTLSATGVIPVAGIALILGVHSLLSSAFVPVNVLGNSLATIVMGRLERAVDVPMLESALENGPEEATQIAVF